MVLRLCHVKLIAPLPRRSPLTFMVCRFFSFTAFWVLLAALTVTACASKSPRGENAVQGRFITETLPGDIRLFRFVISLPDIPVRPITQVNSQGQERQQRRDLEVDRLKHLDRVLDRQPELKTFCPAGYTVVEKYAVLNEVVIRGECKYADERG